MSEINKYECTECGGKKWESNGERGEDLSYCCLNCGTHFSAGYLRERLNLQSGERPLVALITKESKMKTRSLKPGEFYRRGKFYPTRVQYLGKSRVLLESGEVEPIHGRDIYSTWASHLATQDRRRVESVAQIVGNGVRHEERTNISARLGRLGIAHTAEKLERAECFQEDTFALTLAEIKQLLSKAEVA